MAGDQAHHFDERAHAQLDERTHAQLIGSIMPVSLYCRLTQPQNRPEKRLSKRRLRKRHFQEPSILHPTQT